MVLVEDSIVQHLCGQTSIITVNHPRFFTGKSKL
jgi:hypothetical protein